MLLGNPTRIDRSIITFELLYLSSPCSGMFFKFIQQLCEFYESLGCFLL